MALISLSERQYGGGGYVECCERVVDPIFLISIIAGMYILYLYLQCMILCLLALAGLTFWLRLQVVTSISASPRSFSDKTRYESLDSLLSNLAAGLENIGQLSSFEMHADGVTRKYKFQCHINFAACLSSTSMIALKERAVTEMDILAMVAEGLAEFFATGDIADTWRKLRKINHVVMAARCLNTYEIC